jgi:hypothetical protein
VVKGERAEGWIGNNKPEAGESMTSQTTHCTSMRDGTECLAYLTDFSVLLSRLLYVMQYRFCSCHSR